MRVLSKTTAPASSSSAVQTHLRNNTVLRSFICLPGICSYFWVVLVTDWNPAPLFTLSFVSEGDQKCLWDRMNTVEPTTVYTTDTTRKKSAELNFPHLILTTKDSARSDNSINFFLQFHYCKLHKLAFVGQLIYEKCYIRHLVCGRYLRRTNKMRAVIFGLAKKKWIVYSLLC